MSVIKGIIVVNSNEPSTVVMLRELSQPDKNKISVLDSIMAELGAADLN